ncbi:MAG: hypothetical protein PF542_02010 [Nanoarchaeota archaeon]|jgi:hypothetical protein|nr:hypothetical protein [Nanoarchaeota archaeon]
MNYQINEKTPAELRCVIGACPAIYEGIKEITPKELKCIAAACPSIYEGFKDITPISNRCGIGVCPAIYESEKKKNVYLVIGKLLPKKSLNNIGLGYLEKKIGEDEVLIEVPRTLIDNLGK